MLSSQTSVPCGPRVAATTSSESKGEQYSGSATADDCLAHAFTVEYLMALSVRALGPTCSAESN